MRNIELKSFFASSKTGYDDLKIHTIQILRGIAVVSVVLFHAKSGLFRNGYLGVDVFFVISGYLIYPKLRIAVENKKLKSFFLKRTLRLGIPLAVMICFTLPLILIMGTWRSHQQFIIQSVFTILLLGNISAFLVSGGYFEPNSFMPLVHTWSLSVEEQFYIFASILAKLKTKLLIYLLMIASILTFIMFVHEKNIWESWMFYMLFPRLWEFGIGALSYDFLKTKNKNIRFGISKIRISLALLLLILIFPRQLNPLLSTLAVVVLTTYITGICHALKPKSNLLRWIGDRSYSIYLYHMPLLYIAKFSPLVYSNNRQIETLISLIFIFLVAHLSYKLFEKNLYSQLLTKYENVMNV